MSVRQYKGRPDHWVIDYYPRGGKGKKVLKVVVGTEAYAKELESELRRTYRIPDPVNPKIDDVSDEWLKNYKINHLPTTYADVSNASKYLRKHFGQLRFNQLAPAVFEEYKAKRLNDGVSKRTITKELCYMSSFVKWAAKNNHCAPLPFRIEKFPRLKSPKPVIPSPQTIQAIIDAIEPRYRPLFLLMYDGGLRLTEALTLQAENVHTGNGTMLVKGKGEKERTVPITTQRLMGELEQALKARKKGCLFVNPKTDKPYHSIRKPIKRACDKAGVTQHIYHHLLRHSFGTHGLLAGIPIRALQGIMGHEDVSTTEIYVQLLGEYVKKEGGKFDAFITGEPEKKKKKAKKKPTSSRPVAKKKKKGLRETS